VHSARFICALKLPPPLADAQCNTTSRPASRKRSETTKSLKLGRLALMHDVDVALIRRKLFAAGFHQLQQALDPIAKPQAGVCFRR